MRKKLVQTNPKIWRRIYSEACVRDNRMATGHGYLATCVCASPSEKRITSTLSRPGSDGHPIQQSRNAFKTYKCNLQTWQDLKWSYSRLVDCTYVGRMQKIRSRIEFSLKNNWDPCNSSSLFMASCAFYRPRSDVPFPRLGNNK